MNPGNNEPRHFAGAGGRRESAVGGASPTVAHPLDIPQQGRRQPPGKMLASIRRLILRTYWQAAKRAYKRGDYADYGSADWCALDLDDPRKMAGLVAFAQMWWKYGDEIAEDLNRQLANPEPLWARATPEALDGAVRDLRAKQQRRSRKEAA